MRIKDYFGAVGSKPLVFGLAWDVTDGVNIDLDASAILLSGDKLVDVRCSPPPSVPHPHLTSSHPILPYPGPGPGPRPSPRPSPSPSPSLSPSPHPTCAGTRSFRLYVICLSPLYYRHPRLPRT